MLKEMIVVEGEHDKIAIHQALEADVIVTGGFAITPQLIERVRLAQERRGVIVLTDPDYAGEQIRRRLSRAVAGMKHAFVPREAAARGDDIGVENASPDAIREALAKVRTATLDVAPQFAWSEMLQFRLTGNPSAAQRRSVLGRHLGIGYGNTKQFFHRLNAYGVTRADFAEALRALDGGEGHE